MLSASRWETDKSMNWLSSSGDWRMCSLPVGHARTIEDDEEEDPCLEPCWRQKFHEAKFFTMTLHWRDPKGAGPLSIL